LSRLDTNCDVSSRAHIVGPSRDSVNVSLRGVRQRAVVTAFLRSKARAAASRVRPIADNDTNEESSFANRASNAR